MNDTDQILNVDPFQQAENISGHSYKDCEQTALLGILLTMQNSQNKNQHLMKLDDTTFNNDLDRYLRIVNELGFEKVLELPFVAERHFKDEPPRNECMFMFAHRELGIILKFDTYDSVRVNGGNFYYCWVATDVKERSRCTSSGSYRPQDDGTMYWAGHHDCREALRHNINKLKSKGTFLPKWPADHDIFIWFLHHGDTQQEGYCYKEINAERIAMLPEWVREIINL